MNWVVRTYRSSVGAKLVMALTGILLFLFVVVHLIGNLQAFAGRHRINEYSESLVNLGPVLWIARIGLLVTALLHIATALRLARENDAARPVKYVMLANRQVRLTTRTMVLSGLVLIAYVIYHLAHFTWGWLYPQYHDLQEKMPDGHLRHDVYSMLVLGFQVWWVGFTYLVAMAFLALHLGHGIPSFFQTLGVNHVKYDRALRSLGALIASAIFVGYAALPVAVWFGILRLPEGAHS